MTRPLLDKQLSTGMSKLVRRHTLHARINAESTQVSQKSIVTEHFVSLTVDYEIIWRRDGRTWVKRSIE